MIEYSVTVGDLLTSVSLLLTASGLMVAIFREVRRKQREYADRVREAATAVLIKLDRIEAVIYALYDDLQTLFVEVDADIVSGEEPTTVRDKLWHGISQEYSNNRKALLAEEVETAYASICVYSPEARDVFRKVFRGLERASEYEYAKFLQSSQLAVLATGEEDQPLVSAQLGNELRHLAADCTTSLQRFVDAQTSPLRGELNKFFAASDNDLYSKRVHIEPSETSLLPAGDPFTNLAANGEKKSRLFHRVAGHSVQAFPSPSGREAKFIDVKCLRMTCRQYNTDLQKSIFLALGQSDKKLKETGK